MKMKKSDLIKLIKESENPLQTTTNAVDVVNQGLEKIKNNVEQLKNMGIIGEDELGTDESEVTDDNTEVKNVEENFVDSKIFTIIAEAETPKISKKEILEFLNHK
jgi:hypothetical protein